MSDQDIKNEELENEDAITQEEVDAIIAEYKHQQMLEHMVGPLVSMIVHIVAVFLVVIMASVDGKPAAPKTEVTMMPVEEIPPLEEVTEPEPIEPEPIEVEVPDIVLAPPSDNAAGDPSPADIISPEGAQFTIPDSNSPFKVNVPAGNSRGAFGFGGKGSGGGGGGGSGGGGAPYMNGKLYDLKQTPSRQKQAINQSIFGAKMKNVFDHITRGAKGTPEILNDVYCAEENGKPIVLRSGGIYIPFGGADRAPKAFNVVGKIEPKYWLAHYQANITIGKDTECRFWGEGDEFVSVCIDGKPVLMAGFKEDKDGRLYGIANFKPSGPTLKGEMNGWGGNGFIPGEWIKLKKGQKIKLDVLIAEIPGGLFGATLCIEKKGATYQAGKKGRPMYPLFTTVEIQEDNVPEGDIKKGYTAKIFDIKGGMLTATTEDVYFDRIDSVKLVIE